MSASSPTFQEQESPLMAIDRLPDPSPRSNRRWYRRARLTVVFVAIAANCLTAGGVSCFPLLASFISSKFGLDQARTNSVVVGGLIGQYFSAAAIGSFADHYGPRLTALLAATLNICGFTAFGVLLCSAPDVAHQFGLPIHTLLAISYGVIGSGTISAYFAALNTSTLTFPTHPSIAIGAPLALFGLSSFFLSTVASSPTFTDADGELDVIPFVWMLIVLVGGANLLGVVGLKVMPDRENMLVLEEEERIAELPEYGEQQDLEDAALGQSETAANPDEETPLLSSSKRLERGTMDLPLGHLLKERSFWTMGLAMALMVGPAEMIIGSLGSIITSLLKSHTASHLHPLHHAAFMNGLSTSSSFSFLPTSLAHIVAPKTSLQVRHEQVSIISVANTVSRLIAGALADYLSRPTGEVRAEGSSEAEEGKPDGCASRGWRLHISKPAMLLATLLALAAVYLFAAVGLHDVSKLWILTWVVGWSYGTIFTLTPALCGQIFGLKTFGRNFGLLSYFCAASSLSFTYLYAFLADAYQRRLSSEFPIGIPEDPTGPSRTCAGAGCFQESMWISLAATAGAGWVVFSLARKWRGRV